MARKITRVWVLMAAMALAMPVFAQERLQQISSRILHSLKVERVDLAQEMNLFGQPAFTVAFTQTPSLDSFMRQVQDGKTVFNYTDVIDGHVFLQAELESAYAMLHLMATSANSFRGELSLMEKHPSAAVNPSVFNERVAARFLPWMPAGAQLLMDIELPGREMVSQQLYLFKQSVLQIQREINARLIARQWISNSETSPGMDFWHKDNESLYVFVYQTETGTGVYLMKKIRQATK